MRIECGRYLFVCLEGGGGGGGGFGFGGGEFVLVVLDGLLGGGSGLDVPDFVASVEYPHGGVVTVAVVAVEIHIDFSHLLLEEGLEAGGFLLPGAVGDEVTGDAAGDHHSLGFLVEVDGRVVGFGGLLLVGSGQHQASFILNHIVVLGLDQSADGDGQIDLFACRLITDEKSRVCLDGIYIFFLNFYLRSTLAPEK